MGFSPNPLPQNLSYPANPQPLSGWKNIEATNPTMPLPLTRPQPVAFSPPGGRASMGISPALSDFIEFQTMIAASKNLHLKDKNRVSVLKTGLISAGVGAGLTAIPTTIAALSGFADRLYLIPMLAGIFGLEGLVVGLILHHQQSK